MSRTHSAVFEMEPVPDNASVVPLLMVVTPE